MARLIDALITAGLILLGLILMATPLALWVAWSETVFFIVLLNGGVAAVLYCFLVEYERPPDPPRPGPPYHRVEAWTDGIIARIQRLHPFVHHNRLSATAKFQAAMEEMKRFLFSERDRY
jgi:hypothetical protein